MPEKKRSYCPHAFEACASQGGVVLALRCRACAKSWPAIRCAGCGTLLAKEYWNQKFCGRRCWDQHYQRQSRLLHGVSSQAMRKRRLREQGIASGKVVPTTTRKCGYCHEPGHYKSTCLERESE